MFACRVCSRTMFVELAVDYEGECQRRYACPCHEQRSLLSRPHHFQQSEPGEGAHQEGGARPLEVLLSAFAMFMLVMLGGARPR